MCYKKCPLFVCYQLFTTNDKCFDWTKMIGRQQIEFCPLISASDRVEKIVGKGEKAGGPVFSSFPTIFF